MPKHEKAKSSFEYNQKFGKDRYGDKDNATESKDESSPVLPPSNITPEQRMEKREIEEHKSDESLEKESEKENSMLMEDLLGHIEDPYQEKVDEGYKNMMNPVQEENPQRLEF